ncbi:MAG TPA: rhomboid family intramembrane serine protease [Streptosporangiaceae bacterium]|nr:rhomboid family intramembrane serine protease [Streptosporangiaceae bacterium]
MSCSRCGRPACPDCLRSAAVGQQCVECVREGNRGVRRPAGNFGGRLVSGAAVTWTLVAINVICYLAELIDQNTIINDGTLVGRFVTGPSSYIGVADGQWYRLLTNAFLHEPPGDGIGILHILFNMWALIVVGPALERSLGRVRFLTVYLVSALGGSVFYYLVGPSAVPALGASGAIFGLFGAYFIVARKLRVDARGVIALIVINLAISFTGGIAWQAHIGGLIAGSLLTAAFVWAPRQNRALIQAAATVGMLALLVIGVVIRDQQLVGSVRF